MRKRFRIFAGTLIALVSPLAALLIFGALAVYYLFEHLPGPASDAEPDPAGSQLSGRWSLDQGPDHRWSL